MAWTDSKAAQVGNWLVSAGPGPEPVAAGVVSVATRTLSPGEAGPTKPPPGGYLGIRMAPGESGPKVEEVLRDSAARKAGIKVDDEILSVDDKLTDQPQTLQQVLRKAKPGQAYILAGTVVDGSVGHAGSALLFRVRDPKLHLSVPVRYTGEVPDPFGH